MSEGQKGRRQGTGTIGQRAASWTRAVAAAAALATGLDAAGAQAQDAEGECALTEEAPVRDDGWVKIYRIARSDAAIGRHTEGGEAFAYLAGMIEPEAADPKIGYIYAAIAETGDAVLLGDYNFTDECFTGVLGWVPRAHALIATKAMEVGQVAREHPAHAKDLRERYEDTEHMINERNSIQMRVLLQPEFRTRPVHEPREGSEENAFAAIGDTYFWRYVYKIEPDERNEKLVWYLIATHGELGDTALIDTRTTNRYGSRLQGWVRSDEVVPWPTNLVLEVNAYEPAVRERFADRLDIENCEAKTTSGPERHAPAMILTEKPPEGYDETKSLRALVETHNIEVQGTESCSLWDTALGRKEPLGDAQFLPEGLRDSTVRAHVEDIDKDRRWARVATLGSLNRTITSSERSRAKTAMVNLLEVASEIELVIIADATGSMVREIQAVGTALKALREELSAFIDLREADLEELRSIREMSVSEMPIHVRVSLMLYSDIDHPKATGPLRYGGKDATTPKTGYVFKRLSLANEIEAIEAGIDTAVRIVQNQSGGGGEALFDALAEVITDEQVWSDPIMGQQVLLLITDEDGTPSDEHDAESIVKLYDKTAATHYAKANEIAKEKGYEVLGNEVVAKSSRLFVGTVIFTEPDKHAEKLENLKRQLSDIDMFPEGRIHPAETRSHAAFVRPRLASIARTIAAMIAEEQGRVEQTVMHLERCALDPDECIAARPFKGTYATGFISGPELVARAQYMLSVTDTSKDDIKRDVQTGFVQGFARLRSPGHHATWRRAVMVTEEQMERYNRVLKTISYGIASRDGADDRCDTVEADLVRLVLFFADVISAAPQSQADADQIAIEQGHANRNVACARADAEYLKWRSGTVGETLGVERGIPVDPEGLLGISIADLHEQTDGFDIAALRRLLRKLKAKITCLSHMKADGAALPAEALDPDNPAPEEHCTADGVKGKQIDWPIRVSGRYGGRYVFIPYELLP